METWTEPSRDLPVLARPDVLVAGGGAAGVAAAVAAARRGADTWLVESSTTLGGLATFGLINLLLTLDNGDGHQVVAGLCQEAVDRLEARGEAAYPPPSHWGSEEGALVDHWRGWGLIWGAPPEAVRYSVAFDPEAFVDVCLDMLAEAGVHLRLMTWCTAAPVADGRISAVVVESKSGREVLIPKVVVDATGDGDVLAQAGAAMEQVAIPPYLWFRAGGVDTSGAPHGMWFRTTAPGRALVPWGPGADRVDATDAAQLTRALVDCRRQARASFDRLRADDPAFAGAWLDDYARFLGVTESRRLVGEHVLAKEDGDVSFTDAVARTGHWTRRHVVFDVPYRALRTEALANVLASGRCISTTRYVHQATKEIPAAMATGEAAGAAAAAAAAAAGTAGAVDVHAVDVDALRSDLASAGALVGGPVPAPTGGKDGPRVNDST